ncbi:MAG: hypothetical protein KF773_15315 [Deltaproteobacteria bacterium]|nr:hypothetical protein [Deltaproteobacteria bacterium]
MAELVACVRCGAVDGVELPVEDAATVTCAACAAAQPAHDYLSPMAQLKRATTATSKLPKIAVGIPEDLRHRVDERKAKRRIAVAIAVAVGVVAGILVGIAMLGA